MRSKFCGYFILKENNRNIKGFQIQWVTSACERPGDTLVYTVTIVRDTRLRTPVATAAEKWIQTPRRPESLSNLIVIFLSEVLQVISEGFRRRRGRRARARRPRGRSGFTSCQGGLTCVCVHICSCLRLEPCTGPRVHVCCCQNEHWQAHYSQLIRTKRR